MHNSQIQVWQKINIKMNVVSTKRIANLKNIQNGK